MYRSKKLALIGDLARGFLASDPTATVEDMIFDPQIMAAIDDYEPPKQRALNRAKDILRGAIILDTDAEGKPHYVSVFQPTFFTADVSQPPIVTTENRYLPREIAAIGPRAQRHSDIRRDMKGVITRLERFYWMKPSAMTTIRTVLDDVQAQLLA